MKVVFRSSMVIVTTVKTCGSTHSFHVLFFHLPEATDFRKTFGEDTQADDGVDEDAEDAEDDANDTASKYFCSNLH